MDGNKDDALKCLKIGKDAKEAGDRSRALKFLEKARRLDPSLPIDDLVSDLKKKPDESAAEDSSGSAANDSSKPSDRPSLRQRGSSSSAAGSSSPSASFTEEQRAIVREIKSKKDYYEILGLKNNCTVEDLRKAYRKLSLKVHPDKNKAPGSEEAFKSVSKAFQCLSKEDTRRKYDISGSDEPAYQPRRAARRTNGFSGFYDDEFDADEIFRSFFGGGMAPTTTHFRSFNFNSRPRTPNQASDTGFNPRVLLQMLPVVFILLLNFLPSPQPLYSLSPSYNHEHKLTTHKGVNYFVKSAKFEQEYPINSVQRQRLEELVERDYLSILNQNCQHERQRKQWGFIRETPHCDMIRRFNTAAA